MANNNRDNNPNPNDRIEGLRNMVMDLDARMNRMEGMLTTLIERINVQDNRG